MRRAASGRAAQSNRPRAERRHRCRLDRRLPAGMCSPLAARRHPLAKQKEDRHWGLSSKRHLCTPPLMLVAAAPRAAADLARASGLRRDVAAAAEFGTAGAALQPGRALAADAAAGLVAQILGAAALLPEVDSRVTL